MNPQISAVAVMQMDITKQATDSDNGLLKLPEVEIAIQNYVYPDVKGLIVLGLEQEYPESPTEAVSAELDVEEAYLSFLNLPFGLQVNVGRKLVDFGKLNATHSHHWPFSTTPLVLTSYFGEHNWKDDGILLSSLVPNPLDLYWKLSGGYFHGSPLSSHSHEEEEHSHSESPLEWEGNLWLVRNVLNLGFGDDLDATFGYSLAADREGMSTLQGFDASLLWQLPNSHQKLQWQSEYLWSRLLEQAEPESNGWYTGLIYTLDKSWQLGGRYDWTRNPTETEHITKSYALFATHYLNEMFYIRGEYRYAHSETDEDDEETTLPEDTFILSCTWGFGPHAHRLSE